jgi:hypothetical protein
MVRYTQHARDRIAEYAIDAAWVDRTIDQPDRTAPDPRPGIIRAFRTIPERGGRVLRVAYRFDHADVLVLSAHFDRGARRT